MYAIRSLLLTVIVVCLPALLYPQVKLLNEADKHYSEKRYKEAYLIYSRIYEKANKTDKHIVLKMAECNFFIENYPVAEKYYTEYYTDTLYHPETSYRNYANASRFAGKLELAVKLYSRINRNGGDSISRAYADIFRFYLDSADKIRVYDIDSVYTCISLDATASVDTFAAPMIYIWDFKDGTKVEGLKVSHCFKKPGNNTISLSIRDKATGHIRANDTALNVFIETPWVKFKGPKRAKQYFFVTFDASAIEIPDHDIIEYIWDMGEGGYQLGKKVQHKYNKLNFFNVCLTVVTKSRENGSKILFAGRRNMEVVDNYEDHSRTFEDELKGNK